MCFISTGMAVAGLIAGGLGYAASTLSKKAEAPDVDVPDAKKFKPEAKNYSSRSRLNDARRRAMKRPDINTSPLGLVGTGAAPGSSTPATGNTTLGV